MNQLPATIVPLVKTARLPQSYEQAKGAIAECARLDECAEWADQAAALASYARQADDFELENWARRIRDRAVRRCGEMLRSFDGRGRRKNEGPLIFKSRAEVAREAGLSEHKVRTAVAIAAIPEAEFEAAVESNRTPGTTLLVQFKKLHSRERVRSVTERSLAAVFDSVSAGRAVEGLLEFEKYANGCEMNSILEILLRPGQSNRLKRVRRGIGLAFRLNSALDQAGLRGNPMLRQNPTSD